MTELVFPQTSGMAWGFTKTPSWSSRVQKSVSGKRQAIGYMSYPFYKCSLQFNVLREYASFTELENLQGFFNTMMGQVDTFLFADPADAVVLNPQSFGTGNGVLTSFQLVRTYGGFTEPVLAPSIMRVYLDSLNWRGNTRMFPGSRTNLIPRSQEFDNAAWTKTACTVVANNVTAPDGTATGDTMTEGGTFETPRMNVNINVTAGTSYSYSVYAKEVGVGTQRYLVLLLSAGFGATAQATFDVGTGEITNASSNVTAKIEPAAGGFYRCSITTTPAVTTGSCGVQVRMNAVTGASAAYTGDSTSGLSVWGAQFEAHGEEPGSYIATAGAAASLTDFTHNGWGYITFSAAPVAGALLTWTGTFYWRCAFTQDTLDLINSDGIDIWKTNKITFETIKP